MQAPECGHNMVERDWWKDDDVSDVAEAFETEHSEGVPVPEFGEEEEEGGLSKDALGLVIGASATVIVLLSVAVVLLWVWAEVEDVSIG